MAREAGFYYLLSALMELQVVCRPQEGNSAASLVHLTFP